MIMQCRGRDDASLPVGAAAAARDLLDRRRSRSARRSPGPTARRRGPTTSTRTRPPRSGSRGSTRSRPTDVCPSADQEPVLHPAHPVRRRSPGRSSRPATARTWLPRPRSTPPSRPPRSRPSPTRTGAGSVEFEVRSDVENESLGCNHKIDCSIVVIPINGLSCDTPAEPATIEDEACRKGGRFPPGLEQLQPTRASTRRCRPALWWSASNWANRFSIPITFGLPPDTCDILDPRPPTGFYGSELLAQASLQWSPAYCLDKKRFKFQHNQMSDEAGFNLMESGGGAAAVVSSEHERRGDDPVAYAPTAVTGFSIGYVIDRPDNAGELTDLQAERAADRQADDPVLPRLRPRARAPRHRRQPAGDHERPGVHRAQPGTEPDLAGGRGDAAVAVQLQRRDRAAHRLHRPRQGRDGLRQRQGRPVGDEGQPELQEDQAAAPGVAAAGRLHPRRPRTPAGRTTRRSTSPSSPRR